MPFHRPLIALCLCWLHWQRHRQAKSASVKRYSFVLAVQHRHTLTDAAQPIAAATILARRATSIICDGHAHAAILARERDNTMLRAAMANNVGDTFTHHPGQQRLTGR